MEFLFIYVFYLYFLFFLQVEPLAKYPQTHPQIASLVLWSFLALSIIVVGLLLGRRIYLKLKNPGKL